MSAGHAPSAPPAARRRRPQVRPTSFGVFAQACRAACVRQTGRERPAGSTEHHPKSAGPAALSGAARPLRRAGSPLRCVAAALRTCFRCFRPAQEAACPQNPRSGRIGANASLARDLALPHHRPEPRRRTQRLRRCRSGARRANVCLGGPEACYVSSCRRA